MAKVFSNLKKTGITVKEVYQSQPKQKNKASKGTVVIEVFKDRLRLRWAYCSKRFCLYIGLPDSKVNRSVAEQKARQIELDIASDNFDLTLSKYKVEAIEQKSTIKIVNLFKNFTSEKGKGLNHRTLEKYNATINYLEEYFKDKLIVCVSESVAEAFVKWLSDRNAERTLKERLILLSACWEWGKSQNLIDLNPWVELVKRMKVPPKQMPKPFTTDEMEDIINAFKNHKHYCQFTDYVSFLFGTGCRTGEAVGLQWKHIADDCSGVWIGESFSRGVRKSTKTNKAREITLTPKLQKILLIRKKSGVNPNDLVFTTCNGNPVDDHNFRNRAWKPILTELGIDYRKPYNTRHTLISHALDQGMNPIMVAQLTGHDVKTLYENYAGSVHSRPRLPDILPNTTM